MAVELAITQRDALGCVGVVTDAKAEAASFYGRFGFQPLDAIREGTMHGAPIAMFLDLRTIEAAIGG